MIPTFDLMQIQRVGSMYVTPRHHEILKDSLKNSRKFVNEFPFIKNSVSEMCNA